MAPVNVLELTPAGFKQFLDSFDHVFSDCDGVIWLAQGPLPGVGEFFKLMEENAKTVHFVSNNSVRTKKDYTTMFAQAGISEGFERLTVPSLAMAEYLKSINFDKHVYCVTSPEAKNTFESYGFKIKYGPDVGDDNFANYEEYLQDDPDIGAVAFDSDYKVNMPKLYKAATYLKRPDVIFVNGATDALVPFSNGVAIGFNNFTQMVSEIVKRQPLSLGKPSKHFGEFAMKRAGVTDASRVLFIGDMIEQDVGLGKNTGFITLLVLSHFTKNEMNTDETQPDFFAPSLGTIVPMFNTQKNMHFM